MADISVAFDERGYLDGAIMQWSVMVGEYEVIAFFEHEADATAFAAMKNATKNGAQLWPTVHQPKAGDVIEVGGKKWTLISFGSV